MTATKPQRAAHHPTALTIAGSDSGGGGGIQADLKTFCAHEVFGLSALCAITAQNPGEVRAIAGIAPAMIASQMETLGRYFTIHAAKTGMLATAEVVEAVTSSYSALAETPPPLVVDPVMISSSKAKLLEDDAIAAMKRHLFPLAAIITPNLDEAAALLGQEECGNCADTVRALYDAHGVPILLKGGHLPPEAPLCDYYYDGTHLREFPHQRIEGVNVHGTGCTLSAAIAATLSKGATLAAAVEAGITYITAALENAIPLGGERFLNHQSGTIG